MAYLTPCYLLVTKAVKYPTATLWFWTVNFIVREFFSQLTSIYVDTHLPKIIEKTNRFDTEHGRPTEQRTRPRYYVIAYLGCTLTLLSCACIDILLNKMSVKVIFESMLRYIHTIYNRCSSAPTISSCTHNLEPIMKTKKFAFFILYLTHHEH